jgi:hypothetical protein
MPGDRSSQNTVLQGEHRLLDPPPAVLGEVASHLQLSQEELVSARFAELRILVSSGKVYPKWLTSEHEEPEFRISPKGNRDTEPPRSKRTCATPLRVIR